MITHPTEPRRGGYAARLDLILLGLAVGFIIYQGAAFAISVATIWTILAMLAISLNLLVGFTGLLSLAQIAFYGIGAYAVAILTTDPSSTFFRVELLPTFSWPYFAALPLAIIVPAVVAALLAGVVSKFREDVFLLVTFGFGVIADGIFWNWRGVTRGAFGIRDINTPALGGWVLDESWEFLLIEGILLTAVVALSWFLVSGSFGRVIKAIREDEAATQVLGYKVRDFKAAIWVLAAMISGLAGGLFAGWSAYVDPRSFTFDESLILVAMVIVGGLGTVRGPLIGALVFVVLGELMRFLPILPVEVVGYGRQVILGVLMVLFMLFRPEGIAGKYKL